jgi:hypothetical protein
VATENALFAKAAWRLIPFTGLPYVVSFLDRVNVGVAISGLEGRLAFEAPLT